MQGVSATQVPERTGSGVETRCRGGSAQRHRHQAHARNASRHGEAEVAMTFMAKTPRSIAPGQGGGVFGRESALFVPPARWVI